MHIDDRLATVLRQRAASERAARTQFRQLLDLLNERRGNAPADLEETGWQRLLDLSGQIPAADRARILREDGWRLRDLALILFLAEQEPDVAASALEAAEIAEGEWLLLIPELPVSARGFLRLRQDLPARVQAVLEQLGVRDRGLPPPSDAPVQIGEDTPEDILLLDEAAIISSEVPLGRMPKQIMPSASLQNPQNGTQAEKHESEISALVRRIEAFQAERQERGAPSDDFLGKAPDEVRSRSEQHVVAAFDFETDTRGIVTWADRTVAPSVIGISLDRLFGSSLTASVGSAAFALAHHLPLRGAEVTLSGAQMVAGGWIVDAVPQFARGSGGFLGYLGRFRRAAERGAEPLNEVRAEADALRQVLHELRTPVNAIQGYAEFIQQQMAGPVPHGYRALAAGISGDAARILSGFADLEQLARLESGAANDAGEHRTELTTILAATVRRLRPALQPQGSGFDLIIQSAGTEVPLGQSDAEQLIWRLLASIAAGIAEQEILEVHLKERCARLELACGLPSALRQVDDLFAADLPVENEVISTGLFGAGFALRLARAQARAIDGDLRRRGEWLLLTLPCAAEGKNRPDSGDVAA